MSIFFEVALHLRLLQIIGPLCSISVFAALCAGLAKHFTHTVVEFSILDTIESYIKLHFETAFVVQVLCFPHHLKGKLHTLLRVVLHCIKALFSKWRILLAEILHNFFNRVRVETPINELLVIACKPIELGEGASNSWRDVIHNIREVVPVNEGTASLWVIFCHFKVAIILLLYTRSIVLNVLDVVEVSFADRRRNTVF